MKKIMEEYGGVVVSVVAVVALITLVALLMKPGGVLDGAFGDIVGKFVDKSEAMIGGEASGLSRLNAPVIGLDGDTLTITPKDNRAEGYAIYVDGELKTTIAAQATGAAAVIADGTKALKGTWRFNETVTKPTFGVVDSSSANWTSYKLADVNYTSDVYECSSMLYHQTTTSFNALAYYGKNTTNGQVSKYTAYKFDVHDSQYSLGWINNARRTVDFGTEPQYVSVEFYEWFTANAESVEEFDLNSLGLETGSHRITVKAVAGGFEDSDESNAVIYEVA